MTSQNFSSKCRSFDSLKVRVRCGLISFAAHRRCTLAGEIPAAFAMLRQLQRPTAAQNAGTSDSLVTRVTPHCGADGFLFLAFGCQKIRMPPVPPATGQKPSPNALTPLYRLISARQCSRLQLYPDPVNID